MVWQLRRVHCSSPQKGEWIDPPESRNCSTKSIGYKSVLFKKSVNRGVSELMHCFNNGFVYNALLATLVVHYVTRIHWKLCINPNLIIWLIWRFHMQGCARFAEFWLFFTEQVFTLLLYCYEKSNQRRAWIGTKISKSSTPLIISVGKKTQNWHDNRLRFWEKTLGNLTIEVASFKSLKSLFIQLKISKIILKIIEVGKLQVRQWMGSWIWFRSPQNMP